MAAIGLIGYVGPYALDKSVEQAPVVVVAPFALTQPIFAIFANLVLRGTVQQKSDSRRFV